MMIDFLPEDLVICILSRLHVKSAIRFRCVCKSWYTLLSDPKFIYKNLLFSSDDANINNPRLLIRYWDKIGRHGDAFSFLSYDDKLDMPWTQTLLQFPKEKFYEVRYLKIVGSCWNGLVCLLNNFSTFFLWNPVTNETKEVPLRLYPLPRGNKVIKDGFGFGFGFDSKTNDYKIITIHLIIEDQGQPPTYKFQIYSLRKNSWKELDETSTVSSYSMGASCHWYVRNSVVLSVDLSSETLKTTPLPDDCIFGRPDYSNPSKPVGSREFFALKELVAMVNSRDAKGEVGKSLDIWVLLEVGVKNSWTKFFTIGPILVLRKPLRFWNGDLLCETNSGQLLVYDPVMQEIKSCVQVDGKAALCVEIVPYVANSHSRMTLENIKNS